MWLSLPVWAWGSWGQEPAEVLVQTSTARGQCTDCQGKPAMTVPAEITEGWSFILISLRKHLRNQKCAHHLFLTAEILPCLSLPSKLMPFYLQLKRNEDPGTSGPVSCTHTPSLSPEVKYAGNVYLPVNALDPSLQALHQNNQESKGYMGRPFWKGGNKSWCWERNMKSLKLVVPAWSRVRRNIKDLGREPRNRMGKSVKIQIWGCSQGPRKM